MHLCITRYAPMHAIYKAVRNKKQEKTDALRASVRERRKLSPLYCRRPSKPFKNNMPQTPFSTQSMFIKNLLVPRLVPKDKNDPFPQTRKGPQNLIIGGVAGI